MKRVFLPWIHESYRNTIPRIETSERIRIRDHMLDGLGDDLWVMTQALNRE